MQSFAPSAAGKPAPTAAVYPEGSRRGHGICPELSFGLSVRIKVIRNGLPPRVLGGLFGGTRGTRGTVAATCFVQTVGRERETGEPEERGIHGC